MSSEADCQFTIYLFPGQGSDERLFSGLQFDPKYKIVHIEYPVPEKGMSLPEFARAIEKQIDTTEKYYFIGVSLGGMICTELSEIYRPQKTIIISSAKSSRELPFRYNFQKYFPIYKIVPPAMIYTEL